MQKNLNGKEMCHKDIVMIGFAGLAGSVEIAKVKGNQLISRYPEVFVERATNQESLLKEIVEVCESRQEILEQAKEKAGYFPLSQGGVFAGIRSMADELKTGVEIELRKIPVKQETIEICNFFDINPYLLKSDNSALVLTDHGYRMVHELEQAGITAKVIGITKDTNDKVVINGEEKRFLETRYVDAIYQVLK